MHTAFLIRAQAWGTLMLKLRHEAVIVQLGSSWRRTLRMVSGSVNFRTPAVRPCSDPLRSYLRCRRTSVGKTLPMTTKRTCMQCIASDVRIYQKATPRYVRKLVMGNKGASKCG